MAEDTFDASLDLLRRLDPKHISVNLNNLCTLINNNEESEELTQDLLSSVDTPLKVLTDSSNNKPYLGCDYNRDGDNYRSPYNNQYYPVNDEEAPFPSSTLRQLETKANESFDIYKDLYYENSGVSSVYLWDTEEDDSLEMFAGVVLFKKLIDNNNWDSIHVFEVNQNGSSYEYKLTTSIILNLDANNNDMSLSGNLTRQFEVNKKFDGATNLETFHLINLGQLIENSEYTVRNLLQEVYFDKLKDVILKDLRNVSNNQEMLLKQSELIKGLNT